MQMAVHVYRQLGDAGMVTGLERIAYVEDKNLLGGHVALLFGNYQTAQVARVYRDGRWGGGHRYRCCVCVDYRRAWQGVREGARGRHSASVAYVSFETKLENM